MKKKLTALTLSLVLVLSLVACGGKEKKTETAKTDTTTETSVTSTEKTEEVTPVADESEPEVVEETPEEVIEEKLPTTTEEIKNYFHENGKIGDYIISEDGFLTVKIGDTYSRTYPIRTVNNEIYTDTEKRITSMENPHLDIAADFMYHASHRELYVDPSCHDIYTAIVNKINQEPVYVSLRAEPTDDPNLIKITCIFPDGTIEWLKNDAAPLNLKNDILNYMPLGPHDTEKEYGNWLCIGSDLTTGQDVTGKCVKIPLDELESDTITFITPKENLLSSKYLDKFNKELSTPEALTGLVFHSKIKIYLSFQTAKDGIEQYGNYTLVTD